MSRIPHAGPSAGFDDPLAMLGACHDRVRSSLALLQRLQAHVAIHGADADAQSAARDVRRYFNNAAPAHHEDEERHVVPVLMASTDPQAVVTAARLLDDHRRLRLMWSDLEARLARIEQGHATEAAELDRLVKDFVALHDQHLALEDELAFPSFERDTAALGPAHRQAMGQEMAERRGVIWRY
jgi:hemerythrin-like domain-containing protein